MPRSMCEPWWTYRNPIEGRVKDKLRTWNAAGLRRPNPDRPLGDVITLAPTRMAERRLAPNPSLGLQALLLALVRAALALGAGVVLDPFAGAGSTLTVTDFLGYGSVGFERDRLSLMSWLSGPYRS